jgi:hypothetical protein
MYFNSNQFLSNIFLITFIVFFQIASLFIVYIPVINVAILSKQGRDFRILIYCSRVQALLMQRPPDNVNQQQFLRGKGTVKTVPRQLKRTQTMEEPLFSVWSVPRCCNQDSWSNEFR